MALVRESVTTTVESSNTATPTVNFPTSTPDGRLCVIFAGKDDDPDYGGVPGSWVSIETAQSGSVVRGRAWYVITSSQADTEDLTSDSEQHFFAVVEYSGFDATTPINASAIDDSFVPSANGSAPSVTTDDVPTEVLRFIAVDSFEVTATQATTLANGRSSAGAGVGYGLSVEAGPDPAGSTGTAQFTHGSDNWVALTVAINEGVAAPSTAVGGLSLLGVGA